MKQIEVLKMFDGSVMYIIRGSKKDKDGFIKIGFVFNFPNIAYGKHPDGTWIHYNNTMGAWIIEHETKLNREVQK
jgi:hypothetical protein